MNSPENFYNGTMPGEQMSLCWINDVILRMQNPNNSKSIIDNANKIASMIDVGNFVKYVVSSLEQTGLSKILKIN